MGQRFVLSARGRTALLSWLAVASSVVLYLGWEIAHRGVYLYEQGIYHLDDADEWRYTACSRLVVAGYRLFDQVFSAQPPLLFLSLASGMRVAGDGIGGARWVEMLFGLVALLATAWLATSLGGRVAGGASALLLAVSPPFLAYSHAVEGEVPMMAMATLGLAVLAVDRAPKRALWALLGGLALGIAVLLKLFAFEAFLPALWLILSRRSSLRQALSELGGFLAGGLVPVALDFVLVSPARQWDQVVRMHDRASTTVLPHLESPWRVLADFLTFDLGLAIMAGVALAILLATGRRRVLVTLALWLGGAVVMLLLFRPLFPHHPVMLLTGLATAAGTGLGAFLDAAGRARRTAAALAAAGLLAYLALFPRLVHADRHLLVSSDFSLLRVEAQWLDRHTSAAALVATDDLQLADFSRRLVPPPLCDPSNVRLRAGFLTARDLITATARYRAAAVIPVRGIYQQRPGYLRWVGAHYRRRTWPGPGWVYLHRG